MQVKIQQTSSDFNGPILVITASSTADAFTLGKLFAELSQLDRCVWVANAAQLHIPLMEMDAIGLAKYPQDSTVGYKKQLDLAIDILQRPYAKGAIVNKRRLLWDSGCYWLDGIKYASTIKATLEAAIKNIEKHNIHA